MFGSVRWCVTISRLARVLLVPGQVSVGLPAVMPEQLGNCLVDNTLGGARRPLVFINKWRIPVPGLIK